MEISIPLPLLLDAFSASADRLGNVEISVNSEDDFAEENIAPQVPMFDIIAQQVLKLFYIIKERTVFVIVL